MFLFSTPTVSSTLIHPWFKLHYYNIYNNFNNLFLIPFDIAATVMIMLRSLKGMVQTGSQKYRVVIEGSRRVERELVSIVWMQKIGKEDGRKI